MIGAWGDVCDHFEANYVGLKGHHADGGPAISVGDAIALIDYWTVGVAELAVAIGDAACGRVREQWWQILGALHEAQIAGAWLDDPYPASQPLFLALRRLARELDRVMAYAAFRTAFRGGWRNAPTDSEPGTSDHATPPAPLPPLPPSNAASNATPTTKAMVETRLPFGPFVNAKQPYEIYLGQLVAALRLRGFDVLDAPADHPFGGPNVKVPRTTNADAIALVDSWSHWLDLLPADQPNVSEVRSRWAPIVQDVHALTTGHPWGAVYAKNHELWRELPSVAQQLSEEQNRGSQTVAELLAAAHHLPTMGERIRDWSHNAAHIAEDVTHAAVHGTEHAIDSLKRAHVAVPLVVGGSLVAALLLTRR